MRAGIATVSLGGDLEEKLEAAAAAGFAGVELFEQDLVAGWLRPEEVAARARGLGLGLDMYQPFRDLEQVPDDVFRANLRRAERRFALMHRLGIDTMLLCSNVATATTAEHTVAVDQLGALAELAAEHGVLVAYEALAWGRNVSTVDAAWDLVRDVDHPALGICLDSFHMLARGTDLGVIDAIPGDKVLSCQVADAPVLDMDVLSWSRHHRLFPGEGDWDLPAFLDRVLATGFTGTLSLEVFNDVYRQTDPAVTARAARRSLRALEDATRVLQDARGAVDAGGASRPVVTVADPGAGLEALPAVSAPVTTHVVLAPDAEGALQTLVTALGFTRVDPDAVVTDRCATPWVAGDAHVVVDAAQTGLAARVAAIGIGVADPEGAATRARALGVPVVPRGSTAAGSERFTVPAPDGTGVVFGPLPTGSAPDGDGTGAVLGIDLVGLTVGWDRTDETTGFLRDVLGLDGDPAVDAPRADGLARRRVFSGNGAGVRVAVTTPAASSTAVAPTLVALATDDVLAAVARMRAAGVRFLPAPPNYHDDLGARTGLDDVTVARLRDAGVLVDADATGTYRHAVVEPVGGVVVEVVERSDGYTGAGVGDAAVVAAMLGRHAEQARRVPRPRGRADDTWRVPLPG